jgi:hypothetical protein
MGMVSYSFFKAWARKQHYSRNKSWTNQPLPETPSKLDGFPRENRIPRESAFLLSEEHRITALDDLD